MVLVSRDETIVVGVRGLQRPAPHVEGNLGDIRVVKVRKTEKTSHCASRGMEMQKTEVTTAFHVLHSNRL